MKIGDRVFVHGYIDEIRKDTVIIRNAGGYFGTIPSEVITGELPSVTPKQKRGKWEEKAVSDEKVIDEWQSARCSACGKYHTVPYMYYFDNYNYCPNCGADMRGEQE